MTNITKCRFLCTTLLTNDLGLLTRSLPIAHELRQRGHTVAFVNPAHAPKKVIQEAGFTNLPLRHPLYELSSMKGRLHQLPRLLRSHRIKQHYGGSIRFLLQCARALPLRFAPATPDVWNMDHAAAMTGMLNRGFVKSMSETFMQVISEFEADVVLDFVNPFACIAARVLKKRLITINQADMHPNSPGFIWWKKPPASLPSTLPCVNSVLKDFGLSPIEKFEDLNIGDLTMVVGIPETDPLPSAENCTYIGPILWQKPDAQCPDWLEQLSPEKPIIWVYSGNPRYRSKGTVADSEVVVQTCVQALSQEDVQVILTTGHQVLPKNILPLPPNFHHASYVPGLATARKADVMIHHGGYGSCQTGLYTGTPAVIIPTFSERESNARRIADLGAGEYMLPSVDREGRKFLNPEKLRQVVKRVLTTPTYTKRAQHYSAKLQAFGGPSKTAQLIEETVMQWSI